MFEKECLNVKQILVIIDYDQSYIDKIQKLAPDYEIVTDVDEADFNAVQIVIGWDKALVDVLKSNNHQIKWIQLQSAGADKVPQELLKEQNIILTSSSGMHSKVIAESIIGMMLGHTRQLFKSHNEQVKNKWAQDEMSLSTLENKTLAIVGIGKIGAQTAKIAKAFEMNVIGVNRSGRDVQNVDQIFVQEDVAKAVSEADYVVNILPLTDETTGFFNLDLFNHFKEGAAFINVGRGSSVVTDDLLEALDSDQLSYAALDVFEEEPLDEDHPLWNHDKVLITPHIAGHMEDYIGTLFPIIEENLSAYVKNQEVVLNKIDFEKHY